MGFEPTTASLEGWNSTTELRPPCFSMKSVPSPTLHLLLYFTRDPVHPRQVQQDGGQARIRTLEDISQQIYSLPPLATWVPARNIPP